MHVRTMTTLATTGLLILAFFAGVALAQAVITCERGEKRCLGTDSADQIKGTKGSDKIYGMDGDDTIEDGRGRGQDLVRGQGGDDFIDVSDEGADTVSCGPGLDTVIVGQGDTSGLSDNCELVDTVGPEPT